jgi:hypothetical protein
MSNHDALENVSGKKVYIVFIKMFVLVKINLLKPRFAVGLQKQQP